MVSPSCSRSSDWGGLLSHVSSVSSICVMVCSVCSSIREESWSSFAFVLWALIGVASLGLGSSSGGGCGGVGGGTAEPHFHISTYVETTLWSPETRGCLVVQPLGVLVVRWTCWGVVSHPSIILGFVMGVVFLVVLCREGYHVGAGFPLL